jgi:hypothetical protein
MIVPEFGPTFRVAVASPAAFEVTLVAERALPAPGCEVRVNVMRSPTTGLPAGSVTRAMT